MPRKKRAKKTLLGQNVEPKEQEQEEVGAKLLAPEIESVVPEPKAPEPVKLTEVPEVVEPMKFDEDYVENPDTRIALADKRTDKVEDIEPEETPERTDFGKLTYSQLKFYRRTGMMPK